MKQRIRIDQLLVERGLSASREKAQAIILAAEVLVDEQKIDKPGRQVDPDSKIRLLGQLPRFVSRAGFKLEAALDAFEIDVRDKICLDVGASTGGFTDCLLQRGATKIYAVDAGINQLDWKLRSDPRVVCLEKVNARYLSVEHVPQRVPFACCDVSFISLTLILPSLSRLLTADAEVVVLVKPQFEVGKGQVGKGGIVRDPVLHAASVEKVRAAMSALGFAGIEQLDSPILGAAGNREFLLSGARGPAPASDTIVDPPSGDNGASSA